MPNLKTNVLYYGDNLKVMQEHIPPESVDLIYLDPPFNSQADYNVLFREPGGERSTAQLHAFTDTWHWNKTAEETYQEIITSAPLKVSKAIEALRSFIGSNDVMAYLVMMTVRLVALHRVLKPTGSLYLHCDPTASHYLKVMLDTIFDPKNFVNEAVWKRTSSHNDSKRFGRVHDTLLVYQKTQNRVFNVQRSELDPAYVEKVYTRVDENGRRYRLDNISAPGGRGPVYEWHGVTRAWRYTRENMEALFSEGRIKTYPDGRAMINAYVRYLDESEGQPIQDWWDDIGVIAAPAKERLGYPTQKPLALLERIINSSSNPGDIVLDPFCGCGTAVVAAQKLGRRWIGIDITHLAITVMKQRLQDSFPGLQYDIVGQPEDLEGARALAKQDRYQFQWWALGLVDALPQSGERRKGADAGIDGVIATLDDKSGKALRVIVQVKSGGVQAKDIRDLKGVVDEKDLGLFITLEPPTQPMKTAALEAGWHESPLWGRRFPRVQIITVEDLLAGKKPDLPEPSGRLSTFAKAPRVRRDLRMMMDLGAEYSTRPAEPIEH